MKSSSLMRWSAVAVLATIASPLPSFAQEQDEKPQQVAQLPSQKELDEVSAWGSFLAARHAGRQRDASAAAAYYRAALKQDPRNDELRERAFLSLLVDGDIEASAQIGRDIVKAQKDEQVARLVLGVRNIKRKSYAEARADLAKSVRGPITDLTSTLLSSWAYAGAGEVTRGVANIDKLVGPEWYAIFKDLHAGMMLDFAGHKQEAGVRFERAYKLDSSALRIVQAYGSWLSRNGDAAGARKVFEDFNKNLPNHPLIVSALATLEGGGAARPAPAAAPGQELNGHISRGAKGEQVKLIQTKLGISADGVFGQATYKAVTEFQTKNALKADGVVGKRTYAKLNGEQAAPVAVAASGKTLPPLIDSPQAGAAEALYGLGASLGRRGGEDLSLVYLQLGLYLAPSHPLALLSLADLYESLKKPALAIKAYGRVPEGSPLHRNAAIQMAGNLDTLERSEEAQRTLRELIASHPNDLEAIVTLGNILRSRKQFAECAETYSKGIATLSSPVKANWFLFYFRGICYERSKQWAKAETDLKRALDLFPEQPHVLNYLGYSWVDQGLNLDEGMTMIKRAVQQRPDDGYIVDSLGWAYYRIGNFEEAAKHLERAVELKPDDPTINDHLGDAYWRVGRELEARFQWAHARDLKPEPDELIKIEQKLKAGLTEEQGPKSAKKEKDGNGG